MLRMASQKIMRHYILNKRFWIILLHVSLPFYLLGIIIFIKIDHYIADKEDPRSYAFHQVLAPLSWLVNSSKMFNSAPIPIGSAKTGSCSEYNYLTINLHIRKTTELYAFFHMYIKNLSTPPPLPSKKSRGVKITHVKNGAVNGIATFC